MCKEKRFVPNGLVYDVVNLKGDVVPLIVSDDPNMVLIMCPISECGYATGGKLSADNYQILEIDNEMNVSPPIDCRKTPHCKSDKCHVFVKNGKMVQIEQ